MRPGQRQRQLRWNAGVTLYRIISCPCPDPDPLRAISCGRCCCPMPATRRRASGVHMHDLRGKSVTQAVTLSSSFAQAVNHPSSLYNAEPHRSHAERASERARNRSREERHQGRVWLPASARASIRRCNLLLFGCCEPGSVCTMLVFGCLHRGWEQGSHDV